MDHADHLHCTLHHSPYFGFNGSDDCGSDVHRLRPYRYLGRLGFSYLSYSVHDLQLIGHHLRRLYGFDLNHCGICDCGLGNYRSGERHCVGFVYFDSDFHHPDTSDIRDQCS